ncbi:hypothetical protein F1721_23230 [Saccharopolyspora hirsuta]|uniref:Asp23/Gls24 family envelope stress response protein n=1 Tax=Saccharopolyspora hirsuta TaxID=1837 RepID=A0A5M7BS25_SACHI|nr:hypothetical protein [Saccharopolyspora hirsuta]KAA5830024.1 hypothetical protein F1721_23230 [Saccharopolyspora hirsuta]MBF6507535.1 hypothetical protein [Nocardia farcinica]
MADHSAAALPCGHTDAELLDVLTDSASPELAEHVRTCPHCQAELAELEAVWAPVQRAARIPVEPPHGLVERALMTVRGVRGGLGAAPVELAQEGGTLRIHPQAVVLLTRQLCAEILTRHPGTHLRGCVGDADEVQVDLAVRYLLPAALAEEVQQELAAALQDVLGAGAPAVWVRIADVEPPRTT